MTEQQNEYREHGEETQEISKEEVLAFLSSYEFLKIGKAIISKNWSVAMMAYRRIAQNVDRLGLETMKRQMPQLRMAIQEKNVNQGKNAMALLTTKRVQLLKQYKEESIHEDSNV